MYGYRPYGPVWGPAFFAGQAPGGDPTTSALLSQQQQIDELKFQLSALQGGQGQAQQPARPRPPPPMRRPPPPPPRPRPAAPPPPQQQQQAAPPPPPQHHGMDLAQTIGDVAKGAASVIPSLAAALGDNPAHAIPVNPVWATLGRVLAEASMQVRAEVPYAMQSELFTASLLDRLAVLASALATDPDNHQVHAEFDELTRFLAVHPHSPRLSAFVRQHPDLAPYLGGGSGSASTGCSVCDAEIATGMLGRWDIVGQSEPLASVRALAATMLANIQQSAQVSPMSDFLAAQLASIASPTSSMPGIRQAIGLIRSQGPGISGLADQLQSRLTARVTTSGMGWPEIVGQADPLAAVRAQASTMLANIQQNAQPSPMMNALSAHLTAVANATSLGTARAAIAAIRAQGPGISNLADALQALLPQ